MEITDYLNQWMKLSALIENTQFNRIVKGLQLKHVVALYKIVEEQVAEIEINYLAEKYKTELPKPLQDEIDAGVDFEQSYGGSGISKPKIPHGVFAIALKRFMFHYLLS